MDPARAGMIRLLRVDHPVTARGPRASGSDPKMACGTESS